MVKVAKFSPAFYFFSPWHSAQTLPAKVRTAANSTGAGGGRPLGK
ncbi:hypothetical protein FTUN_7950 [Frigoriglobus tundricola]|uniref:Uncharacterized protein n=1 Tax=Frigoriglobus tundricola TaxID=2774151 RepID=A0A6M5Z4D4_9BACT|nr:hypothetical protein FTUN_7950 [Frigoriglobus tundricola]